MDYVPTKITLTRNTGFSEDVARKLGELAEASDVGPRELATEFVVAGVSAALRCSYCDAIVRADAGAGPLGSDGICPSCLLEKYVEWGLLVMVVKRLLTAIDKANKADYRAALAAIRERMEEATE